MFQRNPIPSYHFKAKRDKVELEERSKNTYNVRERNTGCKIGCNCMHEVEHMGLSLLVNILKVAVIEVFLETENCLGSVVVFSVHLEDVIEGAVVR